MRTAVQICAFLMGVGAVSEHDWLVFATAVIIMLLTYKPRST